MNLIEKQEWVLKGLKCCKNGFCHYCPYNDFIDDSVIRCKNNLMLDALEVMEFQKPHVLTLEEVLEIERCNEPLWCEFYDDETDLGDWMFGKLWVDSSGRKHVFDNIWAERVIVFEKKYGITWRCWNTKPTLSQRKGAEWNED